MNQALLLVALFGGVIVSAIVARRLRIPNPIAFVAIGLVFATLTHAAFNYLTLNAANLAVPILFLLVVGFFVLNDFDILRKEEVAVK